jgi:hypothetical protein
LACARGTRSAFCENNHLRAATVSEKFSRDTAKDRWSGGLARSVDPNDAVLDAGDVLTVTRLDLLARSTRDLLNTLAAITARKPVSARSATHGPTPRHRTAA